MSKQKSKTTAEVRKDKVEKVLDELGHRVYDDMDAPRFPSVSFASRSVKNIVYDRKLQQFILGQATVRRSAGNIKHIRPFTQLLWLAFFSKKLVEEKKTSTLRDVYYSAQAFDVEFMDQAESDELITDLEVLLGSAREEFNVFPEERSAIFGNLTIEYTVPGYEGKTLDLSSHPDGMMIGPALTTAEFRDTDAEMVLAIEKGGLFTRFIEEKVHKKYKALLINTAGQPPRSTRYLLRRLHQELKLPIGILCDADPWGAHIAMVIKSGSANAAHLRDLTTPSGVWLGVWASIAADEPVIVERDGYIRHDPIAVTFARSTGRRDRSGNIVLNPSGLNAISCSSSAKVGVMPVTALVRHRHHGNLYQIRSSGGYTVKTTGDHSVQLFNQASLRLEPARVDSLSKGDVVAACFTLPKSEGLKEINLAEFIAMEAPELARDVFVEGDEASAFASRLKSNYPKRVLRERFYQVLKRNAVKLSYFFSEGIIPGTGSLRLRYSKNRIPIVIGDLNRFGRLMGYFASEGGFARTQRGCLCELTFASHEKEYLRDAAECIERTLALSVRVEQRQNATRIRFGASLLSKLFSEVLGTGSGARTKAVPFVFFNTPRQTKIEFLRGCFRGDRMINYTQGTRLALKTVSSKLAGDLVVLLRQLECVAYIWRSGDTYVVSCADTSSIQDVVEELCGEVQIRSEIMCVPGEVAYSLRHEMRRLVPSGERTTLDRLLFTGGGKTRVGYRRLEKAFSMFDRPVSDERLKRLMWFVENRVALLPVKEVKNLGAAEADEFVYDLEVPTTHTFVGGLGGLILHNSDIVKYKLPSDPLTEIDIKRIYELKADPRYKDKMWHDELDTFLKIKKKSEQEAFSRYGLSYIVDTYLPEKLELLK